MSGFPHSSSGDGPADHPQLIGLDRGTTSCRAYLIDEGGRILEPNTGGLGVPALSPTSPNRSAAFDGSSGCFFQEQSPGIHHNTSNDLRDYINDPTVFSYEAGMVHILTVRAWASRSTKNT